jgi:regulator of replication initiation timing
LLLLLHCFLTQKTQTISAFTQQVTRLTREIELLQHSMTSTATQLEAERSETAALERRLAAQEAAAKREKNRWGEEKKEVCDSPRVYM